MTITGTRKTFVMVVAMADIKMGTVTVISEVNIEALREATEKVVRWCTKIWVWKHIPRLVTWLQVARLQYTLPISDTDACLK
ncbi:hypothetical protein RHGRI_034249 [Rhododendron griersonianum]|uniref:Uncharacterized protein n=1 Tax=Rhododendron griersonianum TaxID=479676 RepID=A0AAV6I2G2_9ERIC|nr:hypothetical protein RHGRI_034249 [Rhododendron griersonianum]